ncbi:diguanylate cyclase [Pleurocapsales cyanobacterium LEGE 10410]|nr:diguanylate cyclase [Pleurocapsales cyanobacterium LEGE 10410]
MQIIDPTIKVLLIDNHQADEGSIEQLLSKIKSQKIQLFKYHDLTSAWEFLQQHSLNIVLLNLDEEPKNSLSRLAKIKQVDNREFATIVIIEKKFLTEALIAAVEDYLIREEISASLLEKTILFAGERHQYIQELQRVKQRSSEIHLELLKLQDLFQAIVNNTSTLVWMIDVRENYTFLNQAWLSFTGQKKDTGLQENWKDRIHPEDLAKCKLAYETALNKCQGFQIEYRLSRSDSTYRTILNTAVRRYNSRGKFAGFLCSCLDVTQRRKIEGKMMQQAQSDRILAEITQNIHSSLNFDVILQTAADEVNQFLQADRIFILEIEQQQQLILLFESISADLPLSCEISAIDKLPNKKLTENFQRLSRGEIITEDNTSLSEIINNSNLEVASIAYSLLLVPIISHHRLWGLLCVEHNLYPRYWKQLEIKLLQRVAIQLGITIKQSQLYQELERANQELVELVVVDSLTKVANRHKFDKYLEVEWKRCTREQNFLSLILCDIDYFKLYNDTYGHQAGDRCLTKVAQAIAKVVKRPADLVARYGGEEFAVILPNTNTLGAKYIAKQIRLQVEALKAPHINSPIDLYVTLSLGVAGCIPDSSLDFSALVEAADKGLYKAKELGRNRVIEFEIHR